MNDILMEYILRTETNPTRLLHDLDAMKADTPMSRGLMETLKRVLTQLEDKDEWLYEVR